MRFVRFASLFAAALVAGCAGGSHSSTLPTIPAAKGKGTGSAVFVIKVPQQTTGVSTSSRSAQGVHPQYVSPATQSITIDIAGPTDVDETANLTVGSSGCTSSLASMICTLTVPGLQPGNYTATLTTYDQTGGTGNVLSAAQALAFTITEGQDNTISLTLSGVPAQTIIIPADSRVEANGNGGYDLLGQGARTFVIESLDADSNIIVGPGAPTFTLSQTSGSLSVTFPSATTTSAPNAFTITPPATYASGTATISGTPTFTGQATDGCAQSGANCAAVTVTVDMVGTIYVANYLNSTVTCYTENGNRQALTGSFSGINHPLAIAYDSGNGYLYVTNLSGVVAGYDQNGNEETLSGSFPGLSLPYGITYDPSSELLYVADYNVGVSAYDQSGNPQTLSGSFPGTSNPDGITYDQSNGYLYVTNNNSTITVYDQNGNEEVVSGSFSGLGYPYGITLDTANGFLYVQNVNPHGVTAYDQSGNQQMLSGSFSGIAGGFGLVYDPSNGFLYVANAANNTMTVYDQNGNEQSVAGSFPGLDYPEGIAIVP